MRGGRFLLSPSVFQLSQIQALDGYDVHIGEWVNHGQFQPRHNIAPRSQAPVIRRRHAAGAPADNASTEVIMHTMKWGLVPHWSKHEDNNLSTINARSENLVQGGGLWGSIRGRKRCAIPCEGYYEWLKKGKERLPHFTKREDGKLMLLAGLYDCVTLEGQSAPLWTFTIVTTNASKEFEWLHDRQPVILSTTEALQTWLDTSSEQWTPALTKLVDPYSDVNSKLTCYAVPKEVGKVGAESPTFIQPISQRQDGIQAMFAKQKQVATHSPARENKMKRSATPEAGGSQSTPTKRRKLKDGPSPTKSTKVEVIDLCNLDEDTKDKPVTKLNTWEDDSHVDYTDDGSQKDTKQAKSATPQVKSPAKGKSPKKPIDNSSQKITSFFAKP